VHLWLCYICIFVESRSKFLHKTSIDLPSRGVRKDDGDDTTTSTTSTFARDERYISSYMVEDFQLCLLRRGDKTVQYTILDIIYTTCTEIGCSILEARMEKSAGTDMAPAMHMVD